jgi:type I restriction enzyme S subunit
MKGATRVPLKDHATFLSGFAFESRWFNTTGDGLPIVRIRDVRSGLSTTYYSGRFDKRYIIEDGDYLIGMDGEFNLARWRGGPALLNQRVCKIDKLSPALDRRYLARYLTLALKKIEARTPFVTVKHLSTKTLHAIQIPLPHLEEQQRLATILDAADALQVKRQRSICKLNGLIETSFVATFGDPRTNERDWALGRIGDVIASATYGSNAKPGPDGDYPVLRMGNLTSDGRIDMSELKYLDLSKGDAERYLVRSGDVLFNRTNSPDLVGKTAVYRGTSPVAFAGYLIRLRMADGHSPDYLAGYLNTRYGKRVLRGMCKSIIGMANINAQELMSIPIPIVPATLQERFARSVVAVERERSGRVRQAILLKELFESLQQRAFGGGL